MKAVLSILLALASLATGVILVVATMRIFQHIAEQLP